MSDQPDNPAEDGRVSDAYTRNWVDDYAPRAVRPYLRLSRADRPIGSWLLLLPCWWGLGLAMLSDSSRWEDAWIFIGCFIGAFVMRGAGCTWNDITDREFDVRVERTRSRPIPSGQVTVKQALAWLAFQCLIGFVVLITFNWSAILLGVASLITVVIYPFAKRFTWWPQIFLGISFNWGALLAWTAHQGRLEMPAILLYAAGILWTLFYDTIYAHQDKEDDALIGVKSTARLFAENTGTYLKWFLVGIVMLLTAAIIIALPEDVSVFTLTVALMGPWALGWHLVWQMRVLDIDNPENCLHLFRANRNAGLLPVLFFALALITSLL